MSIIFNVIKILKDALLPFAVIIFSSLMQGRLGNLLWVLIGIPAVLGLAISWGVLSWLRYRFIVEDGVLKVEQGVLFRKKQYIAQSRIQTIDVVEGLIQRLLGVVKLQVQTAGGQKPEAIMSAVSRVDAEQIRRQLLEVATDKDDQAADDGSRADESLLPVEEPFYLISGPRLLIMAVTSSSIGVVASFLAAGYAQIGNFLGDDNVLNYLTNWLYEIPIILTIVGALITSWMLAIAGTVLKYYGFTIRLSGEKLHISRGLLERRQVAIPLSRIQAIRIVESPIRQPFGWLSVYVESAGYGKGKGESTLLFPLLKRSELSGFIAAMAPQFLVDYELNRAASPFDAQICYTACFSGSAYISTILLLSTLGISSAASSANLSCLGIRQIQGEWMDLD